MTTPPVPQPAPAQHAAVQPSTGARWVIELKVIAMTVAAAVLAGVVELLNAVQSDSSLLGSLPAWVQGLIIVAIPTVVTFLSGWAAKHTPRPELAR